MEAPSAECGFRSAEWTLLDQHNRGFEQENTEATEKGQSAVTREFPVDHCRRILAQKATKLTKETPLSAECGFRSAECRTLVGCCHRIS